MHFDEAKAEIEWTWRNGKGVVTKRGHAVRHRSGQRCIRLPKHVQEHYTSAQRLEFLRILLPHWAACSKINTRLIDLYLNTVPESEQCYAMPKSLKRLHRRLRNHERSEADLEFVKYSCEGEFDFYTNIGEINRLLDLAKKDEARQVQTLSHGAYILRETFRGYAEESLRRLLISHVDFQFSRLKESTASWENIRLGGREGRFFDQRGAVQKVRLLFAVTKTITSYPAPTADHPQINLRAEAPVVANELMLLSGHFLSQFLDRIVKQATPTGTTTLYKVFHEASSALERNTST